MKVDAYNMLGLLQTVSYLAGTFGLLGRVSDSAIVKNQMHEASAALKNCADDISMMFDSSDEIHISEELKRLLADALNELRAQMNAHDQDTINYVDSLIERANNLGVNV